jgi:hypothetical protein
VLLGVVWRCVEKKKKEKRKEKRREEKIAADGFQFDVRSIKKAIIDHISIDPLFLEPIVGWDAVMGVYDVFGRDMFDTKKAKLQELERTHKIIVK